MMVWVREGCCFGAIAVSLFAGFPARSADTSGDIVVTASKIAGRSTDDPRSIQSLDGAVLASRNINSVADLGRFVPGLTFTQSGYGTPVLTIRGIGFYDTSLAAPPAVSLSIDEAPIPYLALAAGAMLDLERVDVLKGPQGTLYGQNSTGGSINFVAAKPTDSLAAGLSESVSRFGESDTEAFIGGPVAAHLGVRLSARYERGGAWQRSDTRDASLGTRDFLTGRVLTRWTPSSSTTVSLNVNGFRDRSDNQAGQLIGVYSSSPSVVAAISRHPIGVRGNRVADWNPARPPRHHSDYVQSVARIDTRTSFATLSSISSVQHLTRNDQSDTDGTQIELFETGLPGRATILAQELRATGDLDALHWLVGGNYQREWIRDGLDARFSEGNFPFDATNVRTRQAVRTYAVFANGEYALTSRLSVEGGIRYTDEVRRFSACAFDAGDGTGAAYVARAASLLSGRPVTIPAGGCSTLGPDLRPAIVHDVLMDRNWSWRGGVRWRPARGAMLYANVSRGHKSGAFPTIGATSSAQFAPARPETVLAYEAGIKLDDAARRLEASAAGFYYDYRDKQLKGKAIDPRLGPLAGLINVPRSHVVGAEVEVAWRPFDGLRFNLGGSYSHSRIDRSFLNYDALGRRADLSGEAFPLTPKWHLTGGADYRWRVAGNLTAVAGLDASYVTSTNAGLGNLPLLEIPAYALVSTRLGVEKERWRIQLFVQNIADQRYATNVSAISPDTVVRLTGRPRTFGVSASYRIE
jgi:outer membrane receptor protein involved in Fe transport